MLMPELRLQRLRSRFRAALGGCEVEAEPEAPPPTRIGSVIAPVPLPLPGAEEAPTGTAHLESAAQLQQQIQMRANVGSFVPCRMPIPGGALCYTYTYSAVHVQLPCRVDYSLFSMVKLKA